MAIGQKGASRALPPRADRDLTSRQHVDVPEVIKFQDVAHDSRESGHGVVIRTFDLGEEAEVASFERGGRSAVCDRAGRIDLNNTPTIVQDMSILKVYRRELITGHYLARTI